MSFLLYKKIMFLEWSVEEFPFMLQFINIVM
jgi:hypothetical protein